MIDLINGSVIMLKKRYALLPSDLSNKEWELLRPLLPERAATGRPRIDAVDSRTLKAPCVLVQTVTWPSLLHSAVAVWGSM